MMEKVFGVEEQGADGDFRADTGKGYVAGRDGDYSKAMGEGCDVRLLLFETFGGCGGGVLHLLRLLGEDPRCKIACCTPSTTRRRGRRATGGRIKRSG
jgi:hypothetical protein